MNVWRFTTLVGILGIIFVISLVMSEDKREFMTETEEEEAPSIVYFFIPLKRLFEPTP